MKNLLLPVLILILAGSGAQAAGIKPRPGKVYQNLSDTGAYKFYDGHKGDCHGCVFRNLVLKVDRYGFQIRGSTADLLIDGVKVSLRTPTTGGDFPAGVAVSSSKARDITVRDSEFSDFKMAPVKGRYTNGDGLDCDSRTTNITIERVYAHDNSDGGIDTKCITTMRDVRAERNYRNFRMWGAFTATTLTSNQPRNAHFWFSQGASGVIDKAVAGGDTGKSVFFFDKPGQRPVEIKECVFNFSVPTKLLGGARSEMLVLGPTCRADAEGYAINTAG